MSAPARSDTVRRHNLGRLVAEVHRDGALTRADLTGRLGLNRSTIGTLSAELVAGRVLAGSVPDPGGRADGGVVSAGRPSHVVGPHEQGPYVVAVDVDVARVAVATVGLGGTVRHRVDVPVRQATVEAITGAAAHAAADAVEVTSGFPVGVGVSVPGSVHDGVVAMAPNLGWVDVELATAFRTALAPVAALAQLPLQVGNDANLGAVAEQWRGQARGHDDAVFLLGRAGVGAGIISGGRLLAGTAGGGGEVGHLCLAVDGPPCHCGSHGCAEVFIGDDALVGTARRHGASAATVADVLTAAAAGDGPSRAAVDEVAGHLGRTVAALTNVLNPSVVIAGGTLGAVLSLAGDAVRAQWESYAFGGPGRRMDLVAATGQAGDACLLGAAEIAFAPLLADPAAFAAATTAAAAN